MADIDIRIKGCAGRITLNRPEALNALSYDMCLAIEAALERWRNDDTVALVVIDAAGDRAFCAGGDIQDMYAAGMAGDYGYGRRFWADEYRLNAKIAEYPKPYVALMQGFTMGGGVGISCHGSHRIVGDSSRIAMPECGIGLVPDVGGSLLLARAPGHLGEFLGLTADRMGPGDAIHAGFADHYLPEADWPSLIARLQQTGDVGLVAAAVRSAPDSPLAAQQAAIDTLFAADTLRDIWRGLPGDAGVLGGSARKAIARNAPLSMAVTVQMLHNLRAGRRNVRAALAQEYRFTARSMELGDFIEGIRASIIDKDRSPRWRHGSPDAVPDADVEAMLAPLGEDELKLEGEQP